MATKKGLVRCPEKRNGRVPTPDRSTNYQSSSTGQQIAKPGLNGKADGLLVADHPRLGRRFAAVDPGARFIVGKVCETRFGAKLAPFQSSAAASAALVAEGAVL